GRGGGKGAAGGPTVGGRGALNLRANRGRKAGLTALVASPRLASLEWLDLGCTDVREAQLRALAAGPLAGRLVSLDVSQNAKSLGERGACVLAESGRMKQLQDLAFDHEDEPGVIAAIEAAFRPGVARIDRPGD